MLLLIDRAGADGFLYRTQTAEHGDLRRYYTARAPRRVVLVLRNGLDLADLVGQVVDAQIGYEDAWREFAREGNAGERHTKITVYRVVRGRGARERLSDVARRAPRDDGGRGARGQSRGRH